MSERSTWALKPETVSDLGWVVVGLVFLTGVFHVYAGLVEGRIPVTLAGVGFLGAIVLYLMDYRRRLLYAVGILYTAVQFPLWYVAKVGEFTTLGLVDKTVQIVIIALLAYLLWRSRLPSSDQPASSPSRPEILPGDEP